MIKLKKVEPKVDEYMSGGIGPMKKQKSKPRYPTFRLPLEAIPEAKKWEVSKEGEEGGKEYTVTMKVRMIGISQGRFDSSTEFEIREMGTE